MAFALASPYLLHVLFRRKMQAGLQKAIWIYWSWSLRRPVVRHAHQRTLLDKQMGETEGKTQELQELNSLSGRTSNRLAFISTWDLSCSSAIKKLKSKTFKLEKQNARCLSYKGVGCCDASVDGSWPGGRQQTSHVQQSLQCYRRATTWTTNELNASFLYVH